MKHIITTAILGFAIGYSSMATSSTIQTLESSSCRQQGSYEVDCSFVGGTWASTGIARVYADFHANSNGSVLLDLIRYSYTGTRTEQAGNQSFYGPGSYEVSLATPNM